MTMRDEQERTIGSLTVRIDRLLCVGFEDCVVRAPSVFRLDGDGIACFTETAGPVDPGVLVEACRACPVDALTVTDADGNTLVP
ncbi:MAG: ferredoxin [Longimicrobiales bacterium]